MNPKQDGQIDAQIDTLIRDHLSRELDKEVGGAARRFAEYRKSSAKTTALVPITKRSSRSSEPKFGSFWSIGLVGAALAATLTVVSIRHTTLAPSSTPARHYGPDASITPASYQGEGNIEWKTIDQGNVRFADGTPARQYLQRRVDTITWTDPKTKRTYEYQRPREQTVYVGLKQH